MKHIKQDFSLKAWVSPPGWTLEVGSGAKIQLLTEYGYVAYQIKGNEASIKMVAIFFAYQYKPSPLTLGVNRIVGRLLTLICMIPKLNLGVGEIRFMFCDLHISLK